MTADFWLVLIVIAVVVVSVAACVDWYWLADRPEPIIPPPSPEWERRERQHFSAVIEITKAKGDGQ